SAIDPRRAAMSNNSRTPSAAIAATRNARGQPPSHTRPIASGIATTAKRTRWVRLDAIVTSGADASEATIAALEIEDGVVELVAVEVRPEHRGHIQLGVRHLPEQEVADPHLATGANQQVGIGPLCCVEVSREGGLVDLCRLDLATLHSLRQQACCPGDLGACAVRDADVECQPGAATSRFLDAVDRF